MKAIVTGGAGFIGSHLVRRLIKDGHEVLVYDNGSPIPERLKDLHGQFDYRYTSCYHLSEWTLRDCDVIFHLAANTSVPDSFERPEVYAQDFVGNTKMIQALAKSYNTRFIYSSTSAVYGQPTHFPVSETATTFPQSPYAISKLSTEQMLDSLMMNQEDDLGNTAVCLRYFNVYGDGARVGGTYAPVVNRFLHYHGMGFDLEVTGTGTQTRDFVHVDDVVEANLLVATHPNPEFIYNVGSGTETSVIDIAKQISPDKITHILPRLEPKRTLCDNTKLRQLGWAPKRDLKEWIDEKLGRLHQ